MGIKKVLLLACLFNLFLAQLLYAFVCYDKDIHTIACEDIPPNCCAY
jgi:hypothetical protein